MLPNLDNKYKETKAAELLTHHAKTTAGIVGMGKVLTEVKATLPHGEYTEWMRKHFRFSNATSLRYRRSFAFATSIGDFAAVKLETMALYFCAEVHDQLSMPIPDPNSRTAIEAGFKAILKAARKYLIDEDEAQAIYNGARLAKLAELTNATAANAGIASVVEPPTSTATVESKVAALADINTAISGVVNNIEKVMGLVEETREERKEFAKQIIPYLRDHVLAPVKFPTASAVVIREQSDDGWLSEIENVGEIEFRRHVDHMSALIVKLNATSGPIKMKADRAEAKTKSKS
jgi:hypothetical protein